MRTNGSSGVTVVLHAHTWPDEPALARLRTRLREAWPDADMVDAREEPTHAIGAAAAINRAVAQTKGGWIVVLEPSALPDAEGLAAFAHPTDNGITVEAIADAAASAWGPGGSEVGGAGSEAGGATTDAAGATPASSTHTDQASIRGAAGAEAGLIGELSHLRERRAGTADGVAEGVSPFAVDRTPLFSISRAHWTQLGGLDERLWSVGLVDDLLARARLSAIPVHYAPVRVEPLGSGAPAWPLAPQVARVLRTRSRLITALKTAPADSVGALFAHEAAHALLESWQATGLSEETFRFGGSWGRRESGRPGPPPLRDPAGVIVPLLAIDAALDQLEPLAGERARWNAIARDHAHQRTSLAATRADAPHAGGQTARVAHPFAASPTQSASAPSSAAHSSAAHPPGLPFAQLSSTTLSSARQPFATHSPAAPRSEAPPSQEVARASQSPPSPWGEGAGGEGTTPASANFPAGAAPAPGTLPLVSVIIVNWNGREHLQDCFGSLSRSDYPADRLELICVDNGSQDDSVAFVRAQFPAVRIVALDANRGFTGGNEAGVAIARGDVLVFFNNDMRVEPDCLRELVALLDTRPGAAAACVGARVLSWDGRRIDFIRGSLNFEARGFQDFYAARNTSDLATPADTFFPNGGAFAVTRDAYDRAGGFDPAFFAYYDDVDLGWRLRIAGVEPRVAGRAVAYHRHGATVRTQPQGQKRFLMERNAVWTMAKNYGEGALRRVFGPALALHVRRLLDETAFDRRPPALAGLAPFVSRLQRPREPIAPVAAELYQTQPSQLSQASQSSQASPALRPAHGSHAPATSAHAAAAAPGAATATAIFFKDFPLESLAGAGVALDGLPRLLADRARVQAARRAPDADILPRFGRALDAISPFGSYKRIQLALMDALDLPAVFRSRPRLLLISPEPVAKNMSGPSARVLEMGRALADTCRVTIATPGPVEFEDARVTLASFSRQDPHALKRLAEDSDVILIQGFALALYPFLEPMGVPIIADLYCPFTIEYLEMKRNAVLEAAQGDGQAVRLIQHEATGIFNAQNDQLRTCDYFICASERQRDFWIGALHSTGRINPLTYADDATLRRLIDVVPFGLPGEAVEEAARRATESATDAGPVMRGVWPGIGPDDRILLWAGSMLDWQDPLAVIEAVGLLARTHPDVRLVFMGTRHPNPDVPPMRMVTEGRALAERLGLLDRHVFFNDWVPYDQRARFLLEADLGVSTHTDHLETHFSFRTRMLDYVWGRLPIVCTRGDFFADLVRERGLGQVVPPNDVPALAAAIAHLLDSPQSHAAARAQLAALREELTWTRVVEPLRAFVAQPRLAADRAPGVAEFRARLEKQFRGSKWIRRTALGLGLSERNLERIKRSPVVRAAMVARNQLALRRARRG